MLTHKYGDRSSFFDKIDERENGIHNSSLKILLTNSHTNDDKKRKIKAQLPLEHIFGFCRTFKKKTEGLGFGLQIKTSFEKQNIIYTTLGGTDVNVTNSSIHLYILSLMLSREQQQVSNESNKKTFKLSCEYWVTVRVPVNTGNENQLDVWSASKINVPLYLIAALEKSHCANPARPPNQFDIAPYNKFNIRNGLERAIMFDIQKIQSI